MTITQKLKRDGGQAPQGVIDGLNLTAKAGFTEEDYMPTYINGKTPECNKRNIPCQ